MKKPIIKFEYKTFTLGSEITQEQKDYFKKYGVIQFKNFIDRQTLIKNCRSSDPLFYKPPFEVRLGS